MREVEAETVRLDPGSLLPHVSAEPFPEHVMNQVGRAVVALDVVSARRIDGRPERGGSKRSANSPRRRFPWGPCGPRRPAPTTPPGYVPHVAHLPARFGVERIFLQQQLDPGALLAEREHVGIGRGGVVADELLLPALDGAPLPRGLQPDEWSRGARHSGRPGRTRFEPSASGCRCSSSARSKPACRPPRPALPAMIGVRSIGKPNVSYSLNASSPGIAVAPEAKISSSRRSPPSIVSRKRRSSVSVISADVTGLALELRIDVTHLVHHNPGERREGRLPPTQEPGVTHGPPENPAQHVPPSIVAGIYPVGQQEAHGPGMIREHPVGSAIFRGPVVRPGQQAHRPGQSAAGINRYGSCRPLPASQPQSARDQHRYPPRAWAMA